MKAPANRVQLTSGGRAGPHGDLIGIDGVADASDHQILESDVRADPTEERERPVPPRRQRLEPQGLRERAPGVTMLTVVADEKETPRVSEPSESDA
jgi:hypothetical protein